MSTHQDGADAASEHDVDEPASTEPAVIAEAIGATDEESVEPDETSPESDEGSAESAEPSEELDDPPVELGEDDAGPDVPMATPEHDSAPVRDLPASDYQAPPIPKLGVAVAVLTLIAAAAGLVYYIAFPPATAVYSIDGSGQSQADVAARVATIAPDLESVVLEPEGAAQVQREMLAQILNALIVEDLLLEQAEAAGIEVTEEDLDANLADIILAEAGGDEAAFEALLDQQGLTLEGVRQLSLSNLLIPMLAEARAGDLEITEEEIRALYDQELANVQLSLIVVETEDEALDVIERLESGEPFESVAAEVSIHESGQFGGAMGPFQPGFNPPEFDEAVADAEPGEIVGPVETELGFHVFTLVPPELEPFEELRDDIEEFLRQQRLSAPANEVIASLDEDVEIELDPEYGTWVGVAAGGVMPPAPEAPPAEAAEGGEDEE